MPLIGCGVARFVAPNSEPRRVSGTESALDRTQIERSPGCLPEQASRRTYPVRALGSRMSVGGSLTPAASAKPKPSVLDGASHRGTVIPMRIGIPAEIKADENRVAITPSGVAAFATRGHEVVLEARRGNVQRDPGPRLPGRRGSGGRGGRRGLGTRRSGPQGQGATRTGVRPDAARADRLHLPAPRRVARTHGAASRAPRRRDRLRDGAARRRDAPVAGADVGGRGKAVDPGRRHLTRDALRRQGAAPAGGVRSAARSGDDSRRRRRRPQRLRRRRRVRGRRHDCRHQPAPARLRPGRRPVATSRP